jgi:hypothetical protein
MTLAYVDTDSCIFETTEDPYDVMMQPEVAEYFDLSLYPNKFKAFSEDNKGKLGTFKDEFASFSNAKKLNLVTEFTALRSKCYSLLTLENSVKKCKGKFNF